MEISMTIHSLSKCDIFDLRMMQSAVKLLIQNLKDFNEVDLGNLIFSFDRLAKRRTELHVCKWYCWFFWLVMSEWNFPGSSNFSFKAWASTTETFLFLWYPTREINNSKHEDRDLLHNYLSLLQFKNHWWGVPHHCAGKKWKNFRAGSKWY